TEQGGEKFILNRYRLCAGPDAKTPFFRDEEGKAGVTGATGTTGITGTGIEEHYHSPWFHGRNWSMFQCPSTVGIPPFTRATNLPCAGLEQMSKYWALPKDLLEDKPPQEFVLFLSKQFLPHQVVGVNRSNYCYLFLPMSEEKMD